MQDSDTNDMGAGARGDCAPENPPAFPPTNPTSVFHTGMSLRDWFAGQALAGAMSYSGSYDLNNGPGEMSRRCFELADAMLAERERRS